MVKVGLTGSIAVGKSFVCSVLRENGCHVLDSDRTARDVVAKGTNGLESIVSEFGGKILSVDGELDRKKLGNIVFDDLSKLKVLNSIVHPLVFEAQDKWLAALEISDPNGIAVIDAALMIESGGYKRFEKLIVVWCESAIQLTRLMLRDSLSEEDAKRRIASQMPQDEKKRFADHLIDTTLGFDSARSQTVSLIAELRKSISDESE